jgi:hypothetical protein
MMTSLISFLGGNAFRMIWGEVSHWLTAKQDHKMEMERMELQSAGDAAEHARNLESIKLQADLGVKTIQVQSDADIANIEAGAWGEVVESTTRTIGVAWVDAWNAIIRPGVATWSIAMLTFAEFGAFVLSENAAMVCSAALGIYLADRTLMKRNK